MTSPNQQIATKVDFINRPGINQEVAIENNRTPTVYGRFSLEKLHD
jgi:hypothetical protein